jgi:hypothetical protein
MYIQRPESTLTAAAMPIQTESRWRSMICMSTRPPSGPSRAAGKRKPAMTSIEPTQKIPPRMCRRRSTIMSSWPSIGAFLSGW